MQIIKRFIDLLFACIFILIFLPVYLFIALAIKLDSYGSVLFKQIRVGKSGHHFCIYKFRTLITDTENQGAGVFVEVEDPRITRVGKLLRHTSLDELPQLVNIVKGEMSLVGPRPTLPYQVERYDQCQLKRLEVKPGVTGWAQINGRNSLMWPERIELDLWYINNWTLWLDFIIMLKTVRVVFKKSNLYKETVYDPISGNMKSEKNEIDNEG